MIVSGLLHSTRRETELCGGATTNDLERAGTWTPQKRTSIKQTHSLSNPQQLTITRQAINERLAAWPCRWEVLMHTHSKPMRISLKDPLPTDKLRPCRILSPLAQSHER